MKRLFSLLLFVSYILSACAPQLPVSPIATETITVSTSTPGGAMDNDLLQSQSIEARVEDLLARMTLEEKIGQTTQVEKNSIKPGDITKYYIGSILSGGGGSPSENTSQAWYAMVQGFQNEALGTRLKIPLIYGVD